MSRSLLRLLAQKELDLLEEAPRRGFLLQEKVVPPFKRDKPGARDTSRHLAPHFHWDHEIVTDVHHKRWHRYAAKQWSNIHLAAGHEVPIRAFRGCSRCRGRIKEKTPVTDRSFSL
jgi:hypothetical protein